MALAMIEAAEADGRLRPGQVVVEYTGGSTGFVGRAGLRREGLPAQDRVVRRVRRASRYLAYDRGIGRRLQLPCVNRASVARSHRGQVPGRGGDRSNISVRWKRSAHDQDRRPDRRIFYAGVGLEPAKSATRRGGLAGGGRRCLVCRGSCCSWLRMAMTWARAWSPPTLPAKTMQAMPMAWGAASTGPNAEMTLGNS